jgi:formylmethanofuran:tetrahydromethanopterin formyltransferase
MRSQSQTCFYFEPTTPDFSLEKSKPEKKVQRTKKLTKMGDGEEENGEKDFRALRHLCSVRRGPYPTESEMERVRAVLAKLDAAAAALEAARKPVPAAVHAARGAALFVASAGEDKQLVRGAL